MVTTITISPNPLPKLDRVISNHKFAVGIFSCLTLQEQAKTKGVSHRWQEQTLAAQRHEIQHCFPEACLFLVGGNLNKLPFHILPGDYIGNDLLTDDLQYLPDKAIGWMKVHSTAWTLFFFTRGMASDKTAKIEQLYYFSRVPYWINEVEVPDYSINEGRTQIKAQLIPNQLPMEKTVDFRLANEPVRAKIGFWNIEAPTCRRAIPLKEICPESLLCSCCVTRACIPWTCWYQIAFCCDSIRRCDFTEYLPAEAYASKQLGKPVAYQKLQSNGVRYFPLSQQVNYYSANLAGTPSEVVYGTQFKKLDSVRTRFAILREEVPLQKNQVAERKLDLSQRRL